MKLILIHGRAQAGRNPVEVKKEWTDALVYGVTRANAKMPELDIEFPFYGDELEELVKKIEVPLIQHAHPMGDVEEEEPGLRGEILMEIAKSLGVTDADIDREFEGQANEMGMMNWRGVHAVLRALDRIPGLNSDFIDSFTRDVYVYLAYPGVRRKIDQIVLNAFDQGPCVVLAHSLGTVVAYNVLSQRLASPECVRLITVGSPLGIRGIKRLLATPLRSPPCVKNWFNAYDIRDVVALHPLDAQNFDVTPPIENMKDVMNFTDNRHGIAGYLADPVVAGKIVEHFNAV